MVRSFSNCIRQLIIFLIGFLITTEALGQYPHLGFKIRNNEKSVTIPFELHNNLIVIPIILNNSIPLKFILDTGVRTAILVDKTYSDILNIEYDRTLNLVGADGQTIVEAYVAKDVSLRMPRVIGYGQALLVLKEDYLLLSNTLGIEVHGILGYELFSRFIVKIDYIKKLITLYEPEVFKVKRSELSLPITIEDTKPYIIVKVSLENGTVMDAKLMMDTGASHSILLYPEADERITIPENTVMANLGRGLGGDIIGNLGRVPLLEVSKFEFKDIIASFPNADAFQEEFKKSKRHGTIGGGIMSRFYITFDYFEEKVYLRKNNTIANKFEYNMSGIELIAEGPYLENLLVHQIIEDSNAAIAGIKAGDKLIKVNHQPVTGNQLNLINGIFRSKSGKMMLLVLDRDGQILKKKFRLEKIL